MKALFCCGKDGWWQKDDGEETTKPSSSQQKTKYQTPKTTNSKLAPENRPNLPPKPKAPRPSNHQFSGAKMLVFRGRVTKTKPWNTKQQAFWFRGVWMASHGWNYQPLRVPSAAVPKIFLAGDGGGGNFRNRLFGTKIGLQKSFVMEDFGMFSGCCHLCCVLGTVNINHLTSDKTSNFWFCVFFFPGISWLCHTAEKSGNKHRHFKSRKCVNITLIKHDSTYFRILKHTYFTWW